MLAELDECELFKEARPPEEAKPWFGEVRHEADDGRVCRTSELADLDLDRVQVDRPSLASDNPADMDDLFGCCDLDPR